MPQMEQAGPVVPRPREKMVVYIAKRYRQAELLDRLTRLARRQDRSPSALVMQACEEILERQGMPSPGGCVVERGFGSAEVANAS